MKLSSFYWTINCWPTDKRFEVILFNSFSVCTGIFNLLDIDHNVSPFCTIYTLLGISVVFSCFGTNNPWFGWRVRFFKLFNSIKSFTVILNFLDIDQRLSPLWTIYKS